MKLFRSLGLNPIAASTAFYKKKFSGYLGEPDIDSLENSNMAIHEYIGILWSMLKK